MKLTWYYRIALWLLRKMMVQEKPVLTVEFGWNDPASGNSEPVMGVITKFHATGATLSTVYMRPEQARKLCQVGLESLDKQLDLWQAHWRQQKENE